MIIAGIAGAVAVAGAVGVRAWWRAGRARRRGRRGERIVAKELGRLPHKDFIVLDDILISSGAERTSQIDHIVVSTRGIFVIETKSHIGRISGSEQSQNWSQHLANESHRFYNPLLQNRSHLKTLRRLLPDLDAELFVSAVVFTEAWRLDIKADDIIVSRRFLPDKKIRRTLIPEERRPKRWWRPGREVIPDEHKFATRLDGLVRELRRRPQILDREELAPIAARILQANSGGRAEKREHIRYARETARNVSREIRAGICPRCGGRLVERKGERGPFVGCENYPSCRFTTSIDSLHG